MIGDVCLQAKSHKAKRIRDIFFIRVILVNGQDLEVFYLTYIILRYNSTTDKNLGGTLSVCHTPYLSLLLTLIIIGLFYTFENHFLVIYFIRKNRLQQKAQFQIVDRTTLHCL